MAEIINAKCFGCGRVIRVPALAGGRNAKCPGCGQIFTIPKPADSSLDLVGDDQLPEVATEEEIPEVRPRPAPEEPACRRRITTRDSGIRRLPAPARSRASLAIGAAIGGLILAVGLFLALRSRPVEPRRDPPPSRKEAVSDPDAEALLARCAEYRKVFAFGRQTDIMSFYAVDDKDRAALLAAVTRLLEAEVRYLDVASEGVARNGDDATVGFVCTYATRNGREANRKISWKWRKVDGQWKLAMKPTD